MPRRPLTEEEKIQKSFNDATRTPSNIDDEDPEEKEMRARRARYEALMKLRSQQGQ